jgi:hypothetical protein
MTTMVDSRVRELRTALQGKAAEIDGIGASWKDEDGKFVISTEKKTAYLKAIDEAEEIKGLLTAAEKDANLRGWMAEAEGVPVAGTDAAEAGRKAQGDREGGEQARMERKTLGDYFIESPMYSEAKTAPVPFVKVTIDRSLFDLHAAREQKDIYSGTGGNVSIGTLGTPERLPMRETRLRQRHVRDLFPSARTTAAVLYGVRETGFTNSARAVPQRENEDGSINPSGPVFGLKPKSNITLTPVLYPVATIAHTLDAHRNVLDDEPRLQDFLNRRMVDGVMLAEDRDLLSGNGTGESITGIFNTPGIQTYTGLNTDKFSAQIRRAATRSMLAEYEPNGLVVHPLDWEELELEQDDNGAYRIAISVAVGAEKRVWSLDIVSTTAMTQSNYLVGSFGLGAQFYDRESVTVVVSTENKDNFERNVVTFRAEERAALEVPRPESFVMGTFTTPA